MSFDLYFHRSTSNFISEQAVADYLHQQLPYNISKSTRQWTYENPDTGVYFIINWNDPEKGDDPDDLHFVCSINFFRPQFFGMEVFPIIEKIIDDLQLLIVNPQDRNDPDTPRIFERGYLQHQWIILNDKFSAESFNEYSLSYLPQEQSNAMWWFQLHRQEIEDNLAKDTYVANCLVVKKTADNKLYTACSWPDHIPIILPPVDYVVIKRKVRKLFKTVEESGFVRFDIMMKNLGHFFNAFDHSVPGLLALTQAQADKMEKAFNALPIESCVSDFGTIVSVDKFVNVTQGSIID